MSCYDLKPKGVITRNKRAQRMELFHPSSPVARCSPSKGPCFYCTHLLTWHRERSKAASDHIQSLPGDPLAYEKTSSVLKLSYRFPKAGKVPQKSENHLGHFNSQDVMSHTSPHHRATEGVGIYYLKIWPLATQESGRLRKVISSYNFRFPHFAKKQAIQMYLIRHKTGQKFLIPQGSSLAQRKEHPTVGRRTQKNLNRVAC